MANDDTERARLASSILGNPLLDEALAVLKEGYTQALIATSPSDNEARWRYTTAIKGLSVIRAHLQTVLTRGQITTQQVQQLEDPTVWNRAVRKLY